MNATKLLLALERSKLRTGLLFSIFYISSLFLFAQSPMSIPYQAVLRNADGSVMANAAMTLTFTMHDVAATGVVVYQETHSLGSNAQGLVSCAVGNGTAVQGTFAGINWGSGAKFMQVLMNAGNGDVDLGTQQLMSVPYAFYSNGVNVTVSATGDTLTIGGNSVVVPGISAANVNNNTIPTSGLGSVVLPGNTTCANEFISVTGCGGQTSLTYDGRTYDLVEIGGQCWFADNLATDQYRNGDLIPTGLDSISWSSASSGAYAIYNDDLLNDATYGKLYNWFTTSDTRGLCPSGWHVPSDCEWMYLEKMIGVPENEIQLFGWGIRGETAGDLRTIYGWQSSNILPTNLYGFSALPGGLRRNTAEFGDIGLSENWWSSTVMPNSQSIHRSVTYNNVFVFRYYFDKQYGFNVRCVKDSELPSVLGCTDGSACNFSVGTNQDDGSCLYPNSTCDDGNVNTINDVIDSSCSCAGIEIFTQGNGLIDIDGNLYSSVIVNDQEWMQTNLRVEHYCDGSPIDFVIDSTQWIQQNSGAFCLYGNSGSLDINKGYLYNAHTFENGKNVCPCGWHVPSPAEWGVLEGYLGMSNYDIGFFGSRGEAENVGGKLKSPFGWNEPNNGATSNMGFNAVSTGYRNGNDGSFQGDGVQTFYWTSEFCCSPGNCIYRVISNQSYGIGASYNPSNFGFSIRCIKD